MKTTALLLLLAVAVGSSAAEPERLVDQQLPPLVIYVNTTAGVSGPTGIQSVDRMNAWIDSTNPWVQDLKTLNSQAGLEELLVGALECAGIADASKGCRPSVNIPTQPFTQLATGIFASPELQKLVHAQPSRSALVLEATQNFDGHVYHFMTRLIPVRLGNDQRVQADRERGVYVRYMHTYSKQRDERQRAQSAGGTAKLPPVGSKEAWKLYWSEGEPPRLLHVVQHSIKTTAYAYANALGSSPDAVFADASSTYKKTLPVLSSVIPESRQCTNTYRRLRLARELKDDGYIWVTDTSAGPGIIIIPTCDFEVR